jgi:hypothetical protein
MSVIASSAIENDEDLVITGATSRAMVKMLNNESDKESSEDEDAFEKDESSSAEESESEEEKEDEDEESMDSEAERINEMADQYEENLARGNEHAMVTDKRHARKQHKKKLLIEQ